MIAEVDHHRVRAFAAATGDALWSHTSGGRVDSPVTYYEGRVISGSTDGSVYCLRADDGDLIWRIHAAPTDQRILVYEQIESLWPVHGSVLVQGGLAHFVAGRSAFVDGGMWLYRLDAKTGGIVSKTPLNERNPKTGENLQDTVKWLNMAVERPDILSCDGERLYMRSQAFDLQGRRLDMGPEIASPDQGKLQGGAETHLFCPTGFLDDTWFHRTYWIYGQTLASGWNGYPVAGKYAPAGKIMTVGEDRVFVFGREPKYYRWTTPLEYRLFASSTFYAPAPRREPTTPPPPKSAEKNRKKEASPPSVANAANCAWPTKVPILVRPMTLTSKAFFIAGPRDVLDESGLGGAFAGEDNAQILEQEAAFAGKTGGLLWAVSTADGAKQAELKLGAPPVFDGMAAARDSLYLATANGKLARLSGERTE